MTHPPRNVEFQDFVALSEHVLLYQTNWCHSRVPVLFGDPVQAGEHDGQDDAGVLLDQTHYVLVVPVVQSSLCHLGWRTQTGLDELRSCILTQICALDTGSLQNGAVTDLEVWAGDTSGDLFEERLLDLDELRRFNNIQDFLQLP